MLTQLKLGSQSYPVNIIQGPLAGVSCAPFRYLTWKYGKPAISYTEMISCKTVIHQPLDAGRRYLAKHPHEGPVGFQLSGNDPKELALAVKIVTDAGAAVVDLNCGCPVKKIRGKGAGSSLLADPPHLYKLITAMKQNTNLPVSIKVRVDGGSDDKFNAEIAKVVTEAGADFLIVHGRHWTEHYETACRYDEIKYFVDVLPIPVIGNGDVACLNSLKKMLETGCAGVMIARAGVGQPWLVQNLIAEFNGDKFSAPSLQEIGTIFIEHVTLLTELLDSEKHAILQARKLAKYYARSMPRRIEFCAYVNVCNDLKSMQMLCSEYFS